MSPQAQQLNYAEVLVELDDKDITPEFVDQVQPVLSATVPGARIDMRQLQTNPVNYPVEIRVTSRADVSTADSAQGHPNDAADRVASDGDSCARRRRPHEFATNGTRESPTVTLNVDPDRANLAGITNLDVANSATSAMSGVTVTALQDGDRNIPVVARLKMDERASLSDIQNLYVYGSTEHKQNSAGAGFRHSKQHVDRSHHPASTISARCRSMPFLLPAIWPRKSRRSLCRS